MSKKKKNRGLSTLEYCAVAAIIITITWLGMKAFGVGMQAYLSGIAEWATREGQIVRGSGHSG